MERLIDFSLKNRLLMIILTTIIIAGGYYSYRKLPVDAFPDVSPNLVQVFTTTEGLAPQEVEKYVTFPIEMAMTGLPGLEKIRSVSNFGLSVINIYFKDGMDIYFYRFTGEIDGIGFSHIADCKSGSIPRSVDSVAKRVRSQFSTTHTHTK